MANLSNINNKFIVTDGNNGRVLIGATNDIGATLFANHPSTTAPSLTFNAPAGQVFENEDLQIAFGLNNASPYNGYMQTRFVSAPYYRNLAINPLGGNVGIGTNSPGRELEVVGVIKANGTFISTASSSNTNLSTANGGQLSLFNSNSTDGNFSNVGGYNSNSLVTSQINFVNDSHTSRTGSIAFMTHNGSNMPERMRIDSLGEVRAQRSRSNTVGDMALSIDPGDTVVRYGWRLDQTNNSLNLDYSNVPFASTNTNLVTYTGTGNVGIGTATPGEYGPATGTVKLDVKSGDIIRSGFNNPANSWIGFTSLPGYAANSYPSVTSKSSIHFANNDKYCAFLEGTDTYFGVLNSALNTTVFFATGSQNSYLGGSGNFGVGIIGPLAKLHVVGGTAMTGGWRRSIFLEDTYPALVYGSNATKYAACAYDESTDVMRWYTGAATSDATQGANLRMSLQAGRLGIGTDSPDFALDIEAVSSGVQLQMGRTTTSAGSTWMGSDSNGFHLGVGAYGAGNSVSDPNGFTVLTSGNVGIGVTDPKNKLNIFSGTDTMMGFWGTSTYSAMQSVNLANTVLKDMRFDFAEAFFVGNAVGIGTTTPDSLLQLESSANPDVELKISNTATVVPGNNFGGSKVRLIADGTNGDGLGALRHALVSETDSYENWEIRSGESLGTLCFDTLASERMRIDDSGNIGIGTTTTDALLSTANTNSYTQEWTFAKGYRHFTTYPAGYTGNYNISTKISFINLRGLCVDYYESGHIFNNGAAYYFRHTRFYIMMEGSTLRINDAVLIQSTGNRTDAIVNAPAVTTNASLECLITSTIKSGFTHYVSADMVGSGFNKIKSIS